ncbi:MAG: M23 family metallopeptidase [Calothrix sp. C42_A2020_038]|nr:M23 family metallopeptidase [Calothrix sp. C42_A2020_038]
MRKGTFVFPTYVLVGLILTILLSISTPATPIADLNTNFIYPAKGVISRGFRKFQHEGIDIAGATGTPIYAAAAGKVIKAGWDDWGLGNALSIQHPNGKVTVYGHNHRLLVSKGQQINQGQIIAEMGSTGNSSGPHLHFEIYTSQRVAVDPISFLPAQGVTNASSNMPQKRQLPLTKVGVSNSNHLCNGTTLISGETENARVKVCLENSQLFYIGELKQNPNQPVKLPARNVSDSKYRAENGSFSYFVTPQGVEIWRNGRRFRNDIFYTNQNFVNQL